MGGVSTAPSLRRQRRNGATLCSMPSSVLAESGSLLAVAVERWHVEPRVMMAVHGSWRGASPGTRPHQWLWRRPPRPGRAWIASHFPARRGNLLTEDHARLKFGGTRMIVHGAPLALAKPVSSTRPCEHVSLSVCIDDRITGQRASHRPGQTLEKKGAARPNGCRCGKQCQSDRSLSINGNGHCQGGSLQDGLMRSIFGGEDPQNLAWSSSKHAVQ